MRDKHFVVTGYVVRDGKTLLLYHKKLKMWLPPGGHIDEGETPDDAVRREIREETGLSVEILSPRRPPDHREDSVQYLHVPNHMQLEDIPDHPQHIDLVYFCRALDGAASVSDEHEGMRWHSAKELSGPHIRDEVRHTALRAISYADGRGRERRSAARKKDAKTKL